jgi:PAS domain S-box-containing protein
MFELFIGSLCLSTAICLCWIAWRIHVQLRVSKQQYQELVNTVDGIVWEAQVGEPGYTFVSKQAERILGYPIQSWQQDPKFWQSILHPEDRDRMTGEKYADPGSKQDSQIEYRVKTADGNLIWVKDYIKVIYKNGAPTTMRGIIVDITERKKAEESIRFAQKSAEAAAGAKAEFLANVSHEIRTPLNAIIGMSTVVLDTEMSDDQKDCLYTIKTSADSLLTLINDILDFSKADANKLELELSDFNPSTLCNNVIDVISSMASSRNITLSSDYSEEIPDCLRGDSGRLMQILMNLLSNAVKFTSPSGQVCLNMKKVSSKSHSSEDVVVIRFEVSDTGIGIAEEVKIKLFQPFVQADSSTARRYGGTGLGLSLSKRLVKLMDGEIGVDSEVGKGSVFWFEVPLKVGDAPAEFDGSVVPVFLAKESSDVHILVADDNPANQKVIVRFLEKLGYTAEVVSNGKEAITSFQSGSFDLILMDCQMSEMDGYEATRKIREIEQTEGKSRIRIIALTAHALSGERKKCSDAGMDDYLSKPVSLQQLDATLSFWLSKTQTVPVLASISIREKTVKTPLVDYHYLEGLEILQSPDKPDIFAELIGYFESSAPETVKKVVEAWKKSNFQDLQNIAHCFRSTCNNVGAKKLASTCEKIETLAESGSPKREPLSTLVGSLKKDLTSTSVELKKFLKERQQPILVIDDDDAIRDALMDLFNLSGMPCIGARNGTEALKMLKTMDKPKVILLDLRMPVMNGWEFRKVQKSIPKLAGVPVIVFSADGQLNKNAAQLGALACLKKPIDVDEVINTVKRYCA